MSASDEDDDGLEVFELELLGGEVEASYRAARPEVEAMPWGTLDTAGWSPELVLAARQAWTSAAFQEHRTGAACAAALEALIAARAPLDLVALASRFPLDEMVHVELCARMAMELGGGTEIRYDPRRLVGRPAEAGDDPLLRAAHLVVAYFCVGEALSIPLLQGTWRAAEHPLAKAVLRRIVLDEADHGTFGWRFLDWALPHLDGDEVAALTRTADEAIAEIRRTWEAIRARPEAPDEHVFALGWMRTGDYLELAARSLERQVVTPLRARGLAVAG
ncbi:MAG: hypothetical protein EP329_19610 [Deltaproteobacteria bacterium]|nr:MAG: hypothetical protein EP329_19610 [Deltaproteobacteria bacterium]